MEERPHIKYSIKSQTEKIVEMIFQSKNQNHNSKSSCKILPTKSAADEWDAWHAQYANIFLAPGFFCSQAEFLPTPPPLPW